MKVSARTVAENTTTIIFNFSNTERGTPLTVSNLPGDYIITVNGDIIQKKKHSGTATITIIGGTEAHSNRKDKEENSEYYFNTAQKAAMHQIIHALSITGKYTATIGSGNNQDLDVVAECIFENYRA